MIEKNEEGFLSRWSRKKSEGEFIVEEDKVPQVEEGKVSKELLETDEQSQSLWQQQDVDSDTKKKALSALFKQPEFKEVDHMNEYDEDFTRFSRLGDIVTQEMKRMLRLAEEKTRPSLDEDKSQQTIESHAKKSDDVEKDHEEDKLA